MDIMLLSFATFHVTVSFSWYPGYLHNNRREKKHNKIGKCDCNAIILAKKSGVNAALIPIVFLNICKLSVFMWMGLLSACEKQENSVKERWSLGLHCALLRLCESAPLLSLIPLLP